MDILTARLIRETKKGNEQAFAELVELYKDSVYQVIYRLVGHAQEAQDISQETFLRVYMNLDKYDLTKKFSTWLFRVATNAAIDRLRRRKPDIYLQDKIKGTDDLTYESQLTSSEDLPEQQVVKMEQQAWIQAEINQLPVKYRTIIVLKYLEDLSLKEISEIMDMPIATVKTRVHRGREALRKRMRHL
ncbi:RNA polymerase sigma factor SigW [Shouchella lonarensis]|uniref:RNA polymerase sigma factor SigW n=1 Tax=Shouchella lonarensis TaxID=1464122 RepID=A0A1G6P9H0_9BACI|nr:RNA polymerase sigma factor SigW [Shouchella lonarensis]SDC76872.1 RNA polymerase, sigma subunit, SigW [Shouchella lonarensis]